MKANELMIDDWVYAIDGNGEKHTCRANNLKYDHINKCDDFCVDFYGTKYNPEWPDVTFNVEPIPITPEILEKNGFTYRKSDGSFGLPTNISYGNWDVDVVLFNVTDEYRNNQLHIATPDDSITLLHLMECNHIHELQHALRLCGIEKEIMI